MTPETPYEMTRRVETRAGTMEIHVEGRADGPPVLLVHGAAVSASIWRPVVTRLRLAHRCFVPEMPLGSHRVPMRTELSPSVLSDALVDVLDALGLERVLVVGNDSGGAISQVFTARHAERVAGLLLTNCDALECFPPAEYAYMSAVPDYPRAAAVAARVLHRFPRLGMHGRAYGGLARSMRPAWIRAWCAPLARSAELRGDLASFLRNIGPEVTLEAARALEHFPRPIKMVWGEDDPYFTIELARRLKDALPAAALEAIPGGLTYVMLDAPERVAQAITDFAQDVGKAEAAEASRRAAALS